MAIRALREPSLVSKSPAFFNSRRVASSTWVVAILILVIGWRFMHRSKQADHPQLASARFDREPPSAARHPTPPAARPISVATFNVGNLFDDLDDPYSQDELTRAKSSHDLQRLTATFRRLNADVVALQEVESLGVLEQFRKHQLPTLGYRHAVLCEGNDPRGIDVAVLSRFPIGRVTSHRHLVFRNAERQPVRFRRDLLVVEIRPPQVAPWELWVVHLKSNHDGRETAEVQRMAEVHQLRRLYDAKLSEDPQTAVIVCGDFNASLEEPTLRWLLNSSRHALQALTHDLPTNQRFTYNIRPYQSMVDYLFVSPAMARRYRPKSYRILSGSARSIGSDHNPVRAEFDMVAIHSKTSAAISR